MMGIDEAGLLALLRAGSADEITPAARDRLLEASLEQEGRTGLLSLLNRSVLTNRARLTILEALTETLEPEDVPTLARAVIRQHPTVLLAALPLLEASRTAAALFAVRKPLRRGDEEVDAACEQVAARLGMDVIAERYIRRDGVPAEGFSSNEIGYAAAAAAPETLAALRDQADERLASQIGHGVTELLDQLSASSRNGSLGPFDARLRDELHEVVVLTGIPSDDVQQDRSLDNLFRRRDLVDVRELAPHLPEPALRRYATRALSRSNRQSERSDRALLALEMLAAATPEARAALHDVVLECLDEQDPGLVAGAISTLATDAGELAATERRRVIQRFGTLPAEQQKALAPSLRGLAATAEEELDVESFLLWVDGADDDERATRLRGLKDRWETTVVTAEQATAFLTTLARGINRLPEDEQEPWTRELVESALSWMFKQGKRILESARALLEWPGFARLVLEDLDVAVSLLRAEQARGLIGEILRQAEDPAGATGFVAHAEVEQDGVDRVLLPVLGEAMRRDLGASDVAFRYAEPVARRRLLQSAVGVAKETKTRIDELGQTTQDAADAAVARHGGAVMAALRDAEAASEGNEAIEAHFSSVRRAVESVLASQEPTRVPGRVSDWRRQAADRFPAAVELVDGGISPLSFRASAPTADVMRILSELDQRVHSTRVVTADERTYLRQDLLGCIDQVIDAGLVEEEAGTQLSARPSLGQLLWARWAALEPDPIGRLAQTLNRPLDPRRRQQALLQVDALAGHVPVDGFGHVAGAVVEDALPAAWSLVTAGLANRLRQAESLELEVKSRGVEVMERVAERLDPPLRAIEGLMVGYYRLRQRLGDAGWRPVEETLGKELSYDQLDPMEHEIDGSSEADRYVVRSLGVRVKGRPIRRAVVEPLEQEEEGA